MCPDVRRAEAVQMRKIADYITICAIPDGWRIPVCPITFYC
jgi:hypothetical protein